jgi:hypothetical protein
MKLFAIAFFIVCAAAAALFGMAFALLTVFGRPEAVTAAGALATLPIMSFPKVAEFLERAESRKSLAAGKSAPVYDFRGFQIAWPLMVVYGTIVLLSVGHAFGFAAGFLMAAGSESEEFFRAALQGLTKLATIFIALASYFVGRWIGTRCARQGILTMFLVVLFSVVGFVLSDVVTMPDEAYKATFGGERLSYSFILLRIALLTSILLGPGLLGYWRGRKFRLSKYLDYLLGVLPAETRDTVVDLAFGEAQKVASAMKR